MQSGIFNFVPIESIVAKTISLLKNASESDIIEWATEAYTSFNLGAKYEDDVVILRVVNGEAQLPAELKLINQIMYKLNSQITTADLQEIKEHITWTGEGISDTFITNILSTLPFKTRWAVMHLNESTYARGIHTEGCPNIHATCGVTYTVRYPKVVVTSFDTGYVAVSYKRLIKDQSGNILIPDVEDLKLALFHYCMYMYWMSRVALDGNLAVSERAFHLSKYSLHKTKAIGYLNSPTLDQLENIKNQTGRLVPRTRFFDNMFSHLNGVENIHF